MSDAATTLKVQDISPFREDYVSVVDRIKLQAASSNAIGQSLSDRTKELDEEQVRSLEAMLRNRYANAPVEPPHDPYTEMRIGFTWLQIPPSHIRINEVRHNDSIPGLRTSSSALIKTGHGQIRIDLLLDFVGETGINKELREIIAQFRSTPFIPIESQYIYNAIMAKAGNIPTKEVDTLNLKISRATDEYVKVQRQMVDLLVNNKPFMRISQLKSNTTEEAIRNRLLDMRPDELLTQLSDTIGSDDLVKKSMGNARITSMDSLLADAMGNFTGSMMEEINRLGRNANEILVSIRDVHSQLVAMGIPTASRRPVVPVVLHTMSIETVPDEIDTLRVRLSCMYFAFGPYVQEFAYKTALGTPTLDIGQCPWFSYYVKRRYLAGDTSADLDQPADKAMGYLGKFRFDAGQSFSFQYPTPRFVEVNQGDKGDLIMTVPADSVGPNRTPPISGSSSKTKRVKPEPETLDILKDDKNLIAAQISVVIQNHIAMQPIQGCMYGTAQHLGSANAKITIAFHATGDDKQAHDYAVARIHRMKLLADQVALMGGPKSRRSSKIRVYNDLLSLVGVRAVQIDGISTKNNPGEIYSSTILLDLTEYTVNQEKREQLRLGKPDLRSNLGSISLDYAIDVADRYLRNDQSTERGHFSASNAGRYCTEALYSDQAKNGIITRNVVTQVFANRPEIVGSVIESLKKEFAKTRSELGTRSRSSDSGIEFQGYNSGLGGSNYARASSLPQSSILHSFTSAATEKAEEDRKPTPNEVLGELTRLADEAVTFWASSKVVDRLYGVALPPITIKLDSKKMLEINSKPNKYLKELIETIRGPGFQEELNRLDVLIDYSRDNFEEVQNAMMANVKNIKAVSNYPDLALPTFADAFFGATEAAGLDVAILPSPTGVVKSVAFKVLRVFTSKYLGDKTKEVMRRFMPTWSDLGRPAPLQGDKHDIAKQATDPVDPDFFYYHTRLNQNFESYAQEISSEADALYNPPSTSLDTDSSARSLADADRAKAKRRSNMRMQAKDYTEKVVLGDKASLVSNLDLVPEPNGTYGRMKDVHGMWVSTPVEEGFGNTPAHTYVPADPRLRKAFGELQHDSPANMKSLLSNVLDSTKDDTSRLFRAFPTFRLSFIEEDNEQFGLWDDFYAYNAVIDFQLSEHKFEPSLLRIRLINTTGNLDQARTSYEDQDKVLEELNYKDNNGKFKDPRPPIGSSSLEVGTGERKQLGSFFLQTGTPIMLKVGYGSSDEDLEIKFTGQIVQVDLGDVITILAQSYKNELTAPLNTFIGASAEPFKVVQWVMENSPTIHFGKWSPYETGILSGKNVAGEDYNLDSPERVGWGGYRAGSVDGSTSESAKQASLIPSLLGVLGLASKVADATSDRKLSNIYLPRQSYWRNWLSTKSEFLIPDSTGLEVLNELTRHLPGFICDVRPYDHQATLFFGKPEQRYFYTSLKQNEERLWLNYQREPNKPNENLIIEIILNFEGSDLGAIFKENFRSRHSPGREMRKSFAGVVGSLRGRITGALTLGLMGKDFAEEGKRIGKEQLFGYAESPDITADIKYIEKHLGDVNMKIILAYFFNRYTAAYGSGDKAIEAWVTLAKNIVIPFRAAIHPIETAKAGWNQGMNALELAGIKGGEADSITSDKGSEKDVRAYAASFGRDRSLPGSVFVSLLDWKDKTDKLGEKNDGTNEYNRQLRLMMEKSTDLKSWNMMRDGNSGVTDAYGNQIPRDAHDKMVESILDVLPEWKNFMTMLKMWIERQILVGDTNLLKEAYNEGRKAEKYEHNPRTKRFRDHHFADALQHIIKNGIIATKEQMANTVVIQYSNNINNYTESGGRYFVAYDKRWSTFEMCVNENIQASEKKVRLITELNVDQSAGAELASYANLAEALRPMYRGELILRGNERIKPYDIIWVNDPYENIFGPIEAERVITHFGIDTGYTTTIVPHAICIPVSRSSWVDCLICGQLNAVKSLAWIGGSTTVGAALGPFGSVLLGGAAGGVVGGPPGLGLGAATGIAMAPVGVVAGAGVGLIGSYMWQSWKLNQESGAGIWGNLTGRGRYGSMTRPVDIIPLVKNGSPWTAGLRGWSDDDWTMRIAKRWSNIYRGWGIASEFASKVLKESF